MHSVLVVDDEPLVRLALKSLVPWERHGFRCPLEASNGEQAVRLLENHPDIELVFLDMSMPVMSGLQVLERLQVAPRRPQVVVLSAYDDYPLVREAFRRGASDYILKADLDPERIGELLATVAQRIQTAHAAGRAADELLREEARFLKEDILRRMLEPGGVEHFEDHRKILGIRVADRVRLGVVWIEAQPATLGRAACSSERLRALAATVTNTIEQVLGRLPWGEVVCVREDEHVLFLDGELGEAETCGLLDEVRRRLRAYASVETSSAFSRAATLAPSLHHLLEEARSGRRIASRITVRARQYIQENYHRPELSLAEVSRYLGVSPSHFSHQFAKETGSTFKEYLTAVRLEEAKRLLAETPLKIYEVSERVGYPNVEHFSRLFKRYTGSPPSGYSAGPH